MSTLQAINKIEMSSRETKTFSVDFTQYLDKGERIVGITSVVLSPAGGPAVSNEAYSASGKFISFLLTGTSSLQSQTFRGRAIVSTLKNGVSNTVEANFELLVIG